MNKGGYLDKCACKCGCNNKSFGKYCLYCEVEHVLK